MTIRSIQDDAEDLYDLGRSIYEDISCGPWISAVLHKSNWDTEDPGGSFASDVPSEEDRTIYYEHRDAEYVGQLTAHDVTPEVEIESFKIGSMVEGSDAEIGPYTANTPEEFWEMVKVIDQDVSALWEEANEEGPDDE